MSKKLSLPSVGDANTVNPITLKVADNGSPGLSATQTFMVTVNPLTLPSFATLAWSNGQFSLQVTNSQTGPDYAVQATTNLISWTTVWRTNSPPIPFSWVDTNAGAYFNRFYRLVAGPPLP